MNTNSSNLHDELKRKQDKKRKEKIRFAIALISSNLFVACATYQASSPVKTIEETAQVHHANHISLQFPLQTIIDEELFKNNSYAISLINKKRQLVIKKAYLKSKIKGEADSPLYAIEVQEDEVLKLSSHLDEGLIAIPYNSQLNYQKSKESKYEISL